MVETIVVAAVGEGVEDQVAVMVLRKTRKDIMEMSDPILELNKNFFIRMRHKLLVSILTRYNIYINISSS